MTQDTHIRDVEPDADRARGDDAGLLDVGGPTTPGNPLAFDATADGLRTPSPISGSGDAHRIRFAPGDIIDDRYRIGRFLGAGGFASVYSAIQIHIDRKVALKILELPPAMRGEEFEARFAQEARLAAMLDDEHVVGIHDFGILSETNEPYIAMELLEGHDLERQLRHGALSPRRTISLLLGVLSALGEGHKRGIVHKDLKPANLFLVHPATDNEMLKVLDYGVARLALDQAQGLTATGEMFGTPPYMAPEYVASQHAGPQLDVYQMGLILVEMLTGRRVVGADTFLTCIRMHDLGELPIPVSLLDGPLGPILVKSLARDPKDRFTDCGEFRDALAEIDPDTIRPPQQFISEVEWAAVGRGAPVIVTEVPVVRRGPVFIAVFSCVVALTCLGLVGWREMTRPVSGPPTVATASLTTSDEAVAHDAPVDEKPVATTDELTNEPETVVAKDEIVVEASAASVEIHSTPAGAAVTFDGELLGQTPLIWSPPQDAESPIELLLTSDGYASKRIVVSGNETEPVKVELDKRVVARRPRARPSPAIPRPSPKAAEPKETNTNKPTNIGWER